MMMTRTVLLACLVAACGKSDKPSDKQTASQAAKPTTASGAAAAKPGGASDQLAATDPACAAKTKQLEPWLAQLEIENASHEIDWGYKLPEIDRAAIPLSRHPDWIAIAKELMAYDSTVHETTGADKPVPRTAKALVDKLGQMHATPAAADDKDAPPNDQLRINVDEKAAWSDVVLVTEAAAKAGYTEVLFAFGAKSKLAAPAGLADVTTSEDVASQAHHKLEALQEKCKAWDRAVLRHTFDYDRLANAKAVAHETAAAIAECNCAADPDEVKNLAWQSERWHQAVRRTAVIVKLGGDGATTITLPGKTPWSEAHAKLLDAAPEGARPPAVKLAAK